MGGEPEQKKGAWGCAGVKKGLRWTEQTSWTADTSVLSHPSHFFPPHPKPKRMARQQKREHNFARTFLTRFCLCPSLIKTEMKPAKKVISSLAEGQKTGH